MSFQVWIALGILILLAVFLIACSSGTVILSLEAVISAAEVAVPIIGQQTGLPPATSVLIVTYLQAVSIATGQAAVILASAVTPAQKAAAIIAAFDKAAAGLNLPAGTPSEIVTVIGNVTQAVSAFLSSLQGTPASIGKLKEADYHKLTTLKARTETISTKLKGVKQ